MSKIPVEELERMAMEARAFEARCENFRVDLLARRYPGGLTFAAKKAEQAAHDLFQVVGVYIEKARRARRWRQCNTNRGTR